MLKFFGFFSFDFDCSDHQYIIRLRKPRTLAAVASPVLLTPVSPLAGFGLVVVDTASAPGHAEISPSQVSLLGRFKKRVKFNKTFCT